MIIIRYLSVLLLYTNRQISSTKPSLQIESLAFEYSSISSALKNRNRIGKTGNAQGIPVSIYSISLVLLPRVIEVALSLKKLAVYYTIFVGISFLFSLQSSRLQLILSNASNISSNSRVATFFLFIFYTVYTTSVSTSSTISTNRPRLAPIYFFRKRPFYSAQSFDRITTTVSSAFLNISRSTIGLYALGSRLSYFFGFFRTIVLVSLNFIIQYPRLKYPQNRYLIFFARSSKITRRNLFGIPFIFSTLSYTDRQIVRRTSSLVSSTLSSFGEGYSTLRISSVSAIRGGRKKAFYRYPTFLSKVIAIPEIPSFRVENLLSSFRLILLFLLQLARAYTPRGLSNALQIASLKQRAFVLLIVATFFLSAILSVYLFFILRYR